MGAPFAIKIYLSCCLLVLVIGCNKSGPHGGTGTSPLSPIAASTDPRRELVKAMRAMLDAKAYRARMETSSSSGINNTSILEFAAPDSFHMTRNAELPGGRSLKGETIIIGNEAWMKSEDSPLAELPRENG
jgi:hypothetical protein